MTGPWPALLGFPVPLIHVVSSSKTGCFTTLWFAQADLTSGMPFLPKSVCRCLLVFQNLLEVLLLLRSVSWPPPLLCALLFYCAVGVTVIDSHPCPSSIGHWWPWPQGPHPICLCDPGATHCAGHKVNAQQEHRTKDVPDGSPGKYACPSTPKWNSLCFSETADSQGVNWISTLLWSGKKCRSPWIVFLVLLLTTYQLCDLGQVP